MALQHPCIPSGLLRVSAHDRPSRAALMQSENVPEELALRVKAARRHLDADKNSVT
jgi:hypothetical protein